VELTAKYPDIQVVIGTGSSKDLKIQCDSVEQAKRKAIHAISKHYSTYQRELREYRWRPMVLLIVVSVLWVALGIFGVTWLSILR
jgi:hypothetical protein